MKCHVVFAILLGCPSVVFGFGADDATRPAPPAGERPAEHPVQNDVSTDGAVKAGEHQVLLPALEGLAIGNTSEVALRLQAKAAAGVMIEGFSGREENAIRRVAESVIGKPVTVHSLDVLGSRFEDALKSAGHPMMQVSFPPQEITSGVIAVLICPATAGQVLIAGKPAFGLEFAANAFRTSPGQLISDDVILADLEWINRNPLRRSSISYTDGAADGTLDLTLRVRAEKLWRVYGGIDNQLSDDLGDERIFLGAQYGDLFGVDHRVTTQITSALDFGNLLGFSGIYEIPLPIRHLLQFSAGYTESESDASGPIDQSGEFSRFALDYRIPLPRWNSISQEFRAGLEFRNNDYLFSDGSSQTVRFFTIVAGWQGRRYDRLGSTNLDASLAYNPGRGWMGSEDADYIALGGSGAESLIAQAELERTIKLGEAATLVGRVQGQWSDATLLSSDQLSAGGVNGVRGFDETVGYASNGIIANLELQSKFYRIGPAGTLQGVTFVDAAFLHRDQPDDAGQLAAAGIGLRWRLSDMLGSRLDLGIPIDRPKDVDPGPRLHFAVGASW